MTLLTAMYTTFNSTEAFLNSDRPNFFFVVVVVFCFLFPSTTLYYTFTYKGKITKIVKEIRKK